MTHQMRPPRLPVNFSPCTLTSRVNADQSLIVEFTFPPNCPDAAQFAEGIVDAAAVLANLFGQFSRHIEDAARELRAEAVNTDWKERQRRVQEAYLDLRQSGWRHRAALKVVMEAPQFSELRTRYGWTSAEFHSTVKSFLGPVPLSTAKSRTDV